ncbi:MAG: hypothetical protein GDA48_03050 [Hormoscilla sp. GM102CHS1]|nr:hypothetical protein [Hormoscilla sp. GM102CHS1]
MEHPADVGSSMKEGCALGLAPKSTPSPLFIVDKQNILSDVSQGMVSASVSAACTYMPGAVVEKPDDVKGVVPVNAEQKRSQVCMYYVVRAIALCDPCGEQFDFAHR